MKYLFLLYGPDRPFPQPGTTEFREMLEAWNSATEAMAKAGVLIDCAPLQPPAVVDRDRQVLRQPQQVGCVHGFLPSASRR